MSFSNIVFDSPYYTSAIASAVNAAGVLFVACVINPPDLVKDNIPDAQFCVIRRVDPVTKETRTVKTINARDSYDFIVREGADPEKASGKYGAVALSIHGADIYLTMTIRYNDITKQRWALLKGLAV